MAEINPRFPHKFKVLRPQVDTHGEYVTDTDGNPLMQVVFEGKFGYRTQTSNSRTKGEVYESDYKIALPWSDFDFRTKDILELTDYTRTYQGEVVKPTTYNVFAGTNIWFNERKF